MQNNVDNSRDRGDLERAENYISSLITTMMSVAAVLATIAVGVLTILVKSPTDVFQVVITFLILVAVVLFIFAFWEGRKTHGALILAVKAGEDGSEKTRNLAKRFMRIFSAGLILLGTACFLYFLSVLLPLVKSSSQSVPITITRYYCKILDSSGYVLIILGSIGLICFATKFSISGRIKDLKSSTERLLGLTGYQVWTLSWILILVGSFIQLVTVWVI